MLQKEAIPALKFVFLAVAVRPEHTLFWDKIKFYIKVKKSAATGIGKGIFHFHNGSRYKKNHQAI